MKVLIIENEYDSILPVFHAVERIALKEELDKTHIDKSQSIPWTEIDDFDAIFVDISLATKSQLDGYGIIERVKEQYPGVLPKLAIITGNDMVLERLKERRLDDCNVKIFEKPLRYKEIASFIKRR